MCLLLLVSVASAVWAKDAAKRNDLRFAEAGKNVVLTSESSASTLFKAGPDTFQLYGGPGSLLGKFEDVNHVIPQQQGWTTNDPTDQLPQWQNSTFFSPSGTTAMWAGFSAAQQPGWDTAPGYGNGWNALLTYSEPGNGATGQTVGLTFAFNHDVEPGFDFFIVEYDSANVVVNVMTRTGSTGGVPLNFPADVTVAHNIVYTGNDYGTNNTIRVRMRVTSDVAWSDEDGLHPSNGAAQVDNITITTHSGAKVENFQGPLNAQLWKAEKSPYAGDFGKVFARAGDLDPCREDITPLLGFMDTGAVPNNPSYAGTGTGGTTSLTWNYGITGGWVVNYNGGISLGSLQLDNEWWSPEVVWDLPGTADDGVDVAGMFYRASVYRHLPLNNGMFYQWQVRGRDSGTLVWNSWGDRGFVYYSSVADWLNIQGNVADLLPVSKDRVQLLLAVRDLAANFGFPGTDATPAPYWDNASLQKYKIGGPTFATREIDLFGDSFAGTGLNDVSTSVARDVLDCRVDMNRSISPAGTPIRNGDSVICDITAVIPGTTLASSRLVYSLNKNPVFEDAIRPNAPDTSTGTGQFGWDQNEGSVAATQSVTTAGIPVANRFYFDLPDDGFMYPGDVLEYYIEAVDSDGRTTTLPAGLQGYDDGAGGAQYNRVYEIRGLPTYSNTAGAHPEVLFWNDFANRGGDEETLAALGQNGLIEGVHFDTYSTRGPSSLVDNGLGSSSANGRGHGATVAQISGYSCILYESGDLSGGLISSGTDNSINDKGNDTGLLQTWFDAVDTDRFIAHWGDNLAWFMGGNPAQGASALANQLAYMSTVMGVTTTNTDVRPTIGAQTAPHVLPSGSVAAFTSDFVAFGGCLAINLFDNIGPAVGAVRSHGFEVLGAPGTTYAAPGRAAGVVWDRMVGAGRKVSVTFPYGMMYVYGAPKGQASAQATLLGEVLTLFGGHTAGPAVDAPGARSFQLHASYPNPFNPKTTLSFTLGRDGKGSIKIYNVRGELVRTLSEGSFTAGLNRLEWNGIDNSGASVASGVYVVKYSIDGFNSNQKIVMVK
jgi:hypothetical protein